MKHIIVSIAVAASAFAGVTTEARADATPFIGEIGIFGENFCPRGWSKADGKLLPIASYTALFSLLGTTYGGDGRTTMGLPNYMGRANMHTGRGPGLTERRMGAQVGAATTTDTVNTLASHSHTINGTITGRVAATSEGPTSASPANNFMPTFAGATQIYASDSAPSVAMGPNSVGFNSSVTVSTAGGGQPVNNLQPLNTLLVCVALEGLFPSRS